MNPLLKFALLAATATSLALSGSLFAQTVSFDRPIIDAADRGNTDIVRALIQQGANVDARGKFESTALLRAAYHGHVPVGQLLIMAGADVSAPDIGGATPLHIAARRGHENFIRLLLENKADINARDGEGWTPLMRATVKDQQVIVKQLIAAGADVDLASFLGETPLIIAAQKGNKSLVKTLLAAGADASRRNNEQKNAADIARQSGYEDIPRLIVAETSLTPPAEAGNAAIISAPQTEEDTLAKGDRVVAVPVIPPQETTKLEQNPVAKNMPAAAKAVTTKNRPIILESSTSIPAPGSFASAEMIRRAAQQVLAAENQRSAAPSSPVKITAAAPEQTITVSEAASEATSASAAAIAPVIAETKPVNAAAAATAPAAVGKQTIGEDSLPWQQAQRSASTMPSSTPLDIRQEVAAAPPAQPAEIILPKNVITATSPAEPAAPKQPEKAKETVPERAIPLTESSPLTAERIRQMAEKVRMAAQKKTQNPPVAVQHTPVQMAASNAVEETAPVEHQMPATNLPSKAIRQSSIPASMRRGISQPFARVVSPEQAEETIAAANGRQAESADLPWQNNSAEEAETPQPLAPASPAEAPKSQPTTQLAHHRAEDPLPARPTRKQIYAALSRYLGRPVTIAGESFTGETSSDTPLESATSPNKLPQKDATIQTAKSVVTPLPAKPLRPEIKSQRAAEQAITELQTPLATTPARPMEQALQAATATPSSLPKKRSGTITLDSTPVAQPPITSIGRVAGVRPQTVTPMPSKAPENAESDEADRMENAGVTPPALPADAFDLTLSDAIQEAAKEQKQAAIAAEKAQKQLEIKEAAEKAKAKQLAQKAAKEAEEALKIAQQKEQEAAKALEKQLAEKKSAPEAKPLIPMDEIKAAAPLKTDDAASTTQAKLAEIPTIPTIPSVPAATTTKKIPEGTLVVKQPDTLEEARVQIAEAIRVPLLAVTPDRTTYGYVKQGEGFVEAASSDNLSIEIGPFDSSAAAKAHHAYLENQLVRSKSLKHRILEPSGLREGFVLQLRNFKDRDDAASFCKDVRQFGVDCEIVSGKES